MKCTYTISLYKVLKILEWILFIALITTSGWFASGVLQQFFSRKSSFSQHIEEVTDYPVISILVWYPEVDPCDVKIKYQASGMADFQYLKTGENQFFFIVLKMGQNSKIISKLLIEFFI